MKRLQARPSLTRAIRAMPVWGIFLLLALLVPGAILLGVSFGATAIPVGTVLRVLLKGIGLWSQSPTWDQATEVIILQFRLPIVVGTALVGAALAVAGALYQAILR